MPKPITLEMLHEMTPDQRKTLHRNASGLDTDAARQVLELLSRDDLMAPAKKPAAPKAGKAPAKPKAGAAKRKAAATKPVAAAVGRSASR